jgi:hypothetical protein
MVMCKRSGIAQGTNIAFRVTIRARRQWVRMRATGNTSMGKIMENVRFPEKESASGGKQEDTIA